ncbi:hypothetical protein LCGC14_2321520 [marine sediment metagenome]|uniref:Uncharacterized protein n=1 Tax=marine sediment metagenome TaxID=412755 RepID=A0A0F9CHR9_9ZZZZ
MRVVMGWMIGVASIALLGLIMLILFGNLSGNVGFGDDSKTITVTNETKASINTTGYTLLVVNGSTSGYTLTTIWGNTPQEAQAYNYTIALANATTSTLGVVTNLSTFNVTILSNVSLSYTYAYATPTTGKTNTNNFINNYTKSVSNTSEQFPVVGTIIGIGLLLLILIALLVFALVQLGKMGGGGSGGTFG